MGKKRVLNKNDSQQSIIIASFRTLVNANSIVLDVRQQDARGRAWVTGNASRFDHRMLRQLVALQQALRGLALKVSNPGVSHSRKSGVFL
jgi:hypothetical protein